MTFVTLLARSWSPFPRMGIRMKVVTAIYPNPAPWRFIDNDFATPPQKVGMHPSPGGKSASNHNGRTEADGAGDYDSRARRCEDDERVVHGNIDVIRIDGQNFNVAAGINDPFIGI